MNYGKIVDGNLETLKQPIRTADKHIFTNDESVILENGYKSVRYTNPEEREGYYSTGYIWIETDTEILQVWEYAEIENINTIEYEKTEV